MGRDVEFVLDYGPPDGDGHRDRLHCMCFLAWSCTSPRAGDGTIYYWGNNKEMKRHAHLYFPAVDPIYVLPDWIDFIFGIPQAKA